VLGPIALLAVAALEIELDDPIACVDRPALERELGAKVAADAARGVRLEIAVSESFALRVVLIENGRSLLERTIRFVRADCPDLARLVASIVEMHLERSVDRPRTEALAIQPEKESATATKAASPPIEPSRIRITAAAGLSLGVAPLRPELRIEGLASRRIGAIAPLIGLSALIGRGELEGGARGAVYVQSALAIGLETEPLFAATWLVGQLRGGFSAGWGTGFADSRSVVRPYFSVAVSVRRLLAGPIVAFLGAEVPFTRLELEASPSQDRVQVPLVRVEAGIGLASDL
jgi:hypothetical protein